MGKIRSQLIGQTFGKLKVIAFAGLDARRNSRWLCVCECGRETTASGSNLKRGNVKSCGCLIYQRLADPVDDHPDFGVFSAMLSRCYCRSSPSYDRYGGRGIVVCDGWRSGGFRTFIADMGGKPSPVHSIDRVDNSGNYSCGKCEQCLGNDWPTNCRWATPSQQQRNTSKSKMITFRGETRALAEWAELLGVNYQTLKSRLGKRYNWSVERAFTTPAGG